MSKKLTISLAGCHQGQDKIGVEYGFTPFLSSLNSVIQDDKYKTKFVDFRSEKYFKDPIYGAKILGNNILNCSNENSTLLTFGGDHTISYGTIIAAKNLQKNLKVIWIDAHPDINTPTSSLTGNCHGMPVSYLFGINKDHNGVNKDYRLSDLYIELRDFVYIGVRCLDEFEEKIIEKLKHNGLLLYTVEDVHKYGIKNIMEEIRTKWSFEKNKYKIHVSLDVDSMDPIYTPATGTPVENGLKPRDVSQIISWANRYSVGKMCNLDITEINPLLADIEGVCKTYSVVDKILRKYLSSE